MRVLIMSEGTRGDVQPCLALALALTRAGHARCGADLVVHPPEVVGAAHVAEKLKVPAVFMPPIPWIPTRELTFPFVPRTWRIPRMVNPATYRLQRALVFAYDRPIDDWRETTLGLRRRTGRFNPLVSWHGGPTPVMNAYSRHVVPPPGDTPANVSTIRYLFLPPPPAWEPPPELTDFLDEGGTTVYLGFGSTVGRDPAETWHTIKTALALTGLRAVVCSGWGGLAAADVPDSIAVVNDRYVRCCRSGRAASSPSPAATRCRG